MTTKNDDEKQYGQDLQRRLQKLKNQFDQGKINIAPGLQVIESLKAVRYAPDGTVDLDTVDGLVRSMAMMAEFFQDREELKTASPLNEIQALYFEMLEQNFGEYFRTMQERGLTPHDAAVALSRDNENIKHLTENLPEFLKIIQEFWGHVGPAMHAHIEDLHDTLKGVYGGDLFPTHDENIASKCGIYMDTIILPDPFLRSLEPFRRWSPEQQAYYLIKHAMNLLQYKDLACADINPPIVVIVPDYTSLEEDEQQFVFSMAQHDALLHAERVFGQSFDSLDELMEFAEELRTLEDLLPAIANEESVLFDTEWDGTIEEKIGRAMAGDPAKLMRTDHPGIVVATQAIGRMAIANELLIKSSRLKGTPIIDAPTSWQYFVWKLEYDARQREAEQDISDLHVVRGLQTLAENEMQWLGRVPGDALLELRQQGALSEIREVLSNGVDELASANPGNFHRTSDQVFDNVHQAFDQHQQNVEELRAKKWKFAGSDIGTWLAVGTLEVAAAATGFPIFGISKFAADELLDVPKLKELPGSIRDLARESKDLKKSPVGMLFQISKKS